MACSGDRSDHTTHDGQAEAEYGHVTEVESSLEEAGHLRLREEVVNRVEEDITRGGGGSEEGDLRVAESETEERESERARERERERERCTHCHL
jgi:hypothetical protein